MVSILVVLDDALVHCFHCTVSDSESHVSILVVLDDALVQDKAKQHNKQLNGLNPCCAGRCSSTRKIETILIINMLQNYTKVIFTFLNQKLTIS